MEVETMTVENTNVDITSNIESTRLVKLVTSDGVEFEVSFEEACYCLTLKNMLEDICEDGQATPLPEVDAKTFNLLVPYLHFLKKNPELVPLEDDKKKIEIKEEEKNIIDPLEKEELFNLLKAANFLDLKRCVDTCCKTIADMIKGKTPQEIRDIFGIENDFTPEEEEQIRKENAWCNEENK